MPPQQTVQNNFKEGLKTEFTGLNFPDNAATDTQNCVFSYIGDTSRRGGLNYETNNVLQAINQTSVARSSFRWLNAGGDGATQILVQQIGNNLYFFQSSSATIAKPLSTTKLSSTLNLLTFLVAGSSADPSVSECQYTSGNGYLFVFHPNCEPFYCTYISGVITPTAITLQQRDIIGIIEPGVPDKQRPTTLTNEHRYNLFNQGWTQGTSWSGVGQFNGGIPATGSLMTVSINSQVNTTAVSPGSEIQMVLNPVSQVGPNNGNNTGTLTITGSVTAYNTTTVTFSITSQTSSVGTLTFTGLWSGGNFFAGPANVQMSLVNVGFINTWFSALANYPANSDIWWLYKNTSDVFSPSTTFGNVQQTITPAPKGTFVMGVFNQQRANISNISGLTPVVTLARPSTGTFYQGRVWYSGINASQLAQGDAPYTTWTENIYFSQIIESPSNFGRCYQANDPTSQNLNSLLSSDGGVIQIQGCGAIYKLFPLRFGLLVFAANGVWFISGSSGVGFTADDFAITKISSIETISGTSFLEMQGYPMFWNQEGIYQVIPSAQPGSAHSPDIQLDVKNLTIGTILSYYNSIPTISKTYARGDYDMLNYIVQWCFRSTDESGISNRYSYDTILSYNVLTQAFYPYTLPTTSQSVISDIKYIINPGGSNNPDPVLKYMTQVGVSNITFSEENDFTNYVDFISENGTGYNFNSYFIAGYNLPGQALRKIQIPYIYVFTRNPGLHQYTIQAIWDFAGSAVLGSTDMLSGKWSSRQIVTVNQTDFTMTYRKVRLRGRGMAVQIRIQSIQGQPFDIMGWSVLDQVNQAV